MIDLNWCDVSTRTVKSLIKIQDEVEHIGSCDGISYYGLGDVIIKVEDDGKLQPIRYIRGRVSDALLRANENLESYLSNIAFPVLQLTKCQFECEYEFKPLNITVWEHDKFIKMEDEPNPLFKDVYIAEKDNCVTLLCCTDIDCVETNDIIRDKIAKIGEQLIKATEREYLETQYV